MLVARAGLTLLKGTTIRHAIESFNALLVELQALGVTDEPESLSRALSTADKSCLVALIEASAGVSRIVDAISARSG